VFFLVDNRNVIGKDIPFQLLFRRTYGTTLVALRNMCIKTHNHSKSAIGVPLFYKSAVICHDVDDFSKIWQARPMMLCMLCYVFVFCDAVMLIALRTLFCLRYKTLHNTAQHHTIPHNTTNMLLGDGSIPYHE
jgi:hypothetical protein